MAERQVDDRVGQLFERLVGRTDHDARPGQLDVQTGNLSIYPRYANVAGSSRAALSGWQGSVDREVLAVRGGVGVCDVSTLGKIDVQGGDAGAFLDRVYANTFSTLAVGKVRYGLMLREDGFVMDDGTAARLGERHYVIGSAVQDHGAGLHGPGRPIFPPRRT